MSYLEEAIENQQELSPKDISEQLGIPIKGKFFKKRRRSMTRQFESAKLLTEAGISSLKSAVLIVFTESEKMGEVSIKESEIRKQLGVNEVHGSDRIIFSILDNLAGEKILENLGSAQWRLRKTKGSK